MKPKEQGGVVDPRLNVYGVQGLKVAGRRNYHRNVEDICLLTWLPN
jgi:hypothetical protein